MMIRDRGHALTIEIDIDGNEVLINYFIPKLRNINMINELPGVYKVKDNEYIGTTGIFKTSVNDLSKTLFNLKHKKSPTLKWRDELLANYFI